MKKLLSLPLLIFFCLSAAASLQSADAETAYRDVSISEAANLIKDRENLVILDVRTKEETDQGVIDKDAVLVDFLSKDFEAKVKKLDSSAPYLLHCASGGRSGQAIPILKGLGFTEVYHLKEGFMGWKDAKMTVVK